MEPTDKNFEAFKDKFEKFSKDREIIERVMDKSIEFNKTTLNQLLKVYSNENNSYLDTKYGDKPITTFLSEYKFKSMYDYKDVLRAIKNQAYFNDGTTLYAHYNNSITEKLFNSAFIKLEWIIEHMALNGSFAEINNVVRFIFSKDSSESITFLNQIIDHVSGFKKDIVVYEAIIRYGLGKSIPGLAGIFKHIFEKDPKIEIVSIKTLYHNVRDDDIRMVVGKYLYDKTKDPKYLPQEAQDIFIF